MIFFFLELFDASTPYGIFMWYRADQVMLNHVKYIPK